MRSDVPYDEKTRDATIAETVRDLRSWSIGADEITVSFDPYAVGVLCRGLLQLQLPHERGEGAGPARGRRFPKMPQAPHKRR